MPLVRFVDTVGAGDAFASIVLAGRLLGWPPPLSLSRANEFAAAICGVRGALPVGNDFYLDWRNRWSL